MKDTIIQMSEKAIYHKKEEVLLKFKGGTQKWTERLTKEIMKSIEKDKKKRWDPMRGPINNKAI